MERNGPQSQRVRIITWECCKKVEKNEIETVIIQRRSIRLNKDLQKNSIISENDLSSLRPCPSGSINPMEIEKVIGKNLKKIKKKVRLCIGKI